MAERSMDARFLIASNVRRIRKALGMTQVELAREMGVAQARISEIEHGRADCTATTIDKLCDALHVDQTSLFRNLKEELVA